MKRDFIIENLIIEGDRPAHIARHKVTVDEVIEVLTGLYVSIADREQRWLVIGETESGRFLTIVLGEGKEQHTYGLVTARLARREERSLYISYAKQKGSHEDERKAS